MKVEQRSELQKCKSLLKRLRQPPADAPWCESSSTIAQFAQVMNMCKENAVFVCGAVVDGLSFESKKRSFPLLANYIAQSGSSSSAFFHVHRGLKVEMENIKTKRTSALLLEMGMADKAARSLYRLLDRFLKRKTFSLSKDAAFQLRQKISILKKKAYNLKAVMDTLDKQMSKLSRSISTCGLTLSDMFTQKRYKEQDSSQ